MGLQERLNGGGMQVQGSVASARATIAGAVEGAPGSRQGRAGCEACSHATAGTTAWRRADVSSPVQVHDARLRTEPVVNFGIEVLQASKAAGKQGSKHKLELRCA